MKKAGEWLGGNQTSARRSVVRGPGPCTLLLTRKHKSVRAARHQAYTAEVPRDSTRDQTDAGAVARLTMSRHAGGNGRWAWPVKPDTIARSAVRS